MTNTKRGFIYYPDRPDKLTPEFVKGEYDKLLELQKKADASDSPKLWLELFKEWNALKAYIGSEGSRIGYRFSQDMSDKTAEADDKYFREKIMPAVSEPEHALTKSLLASRHKQAVADRWGNQLLVDYEISLKPLDPVNTDLRVRSSNIGADYEKLVAEAEVEVNGEKMNLSKARSLSFSDDEALRREAYEKVSGWVWVNRRQLAGYYDELVRIRQQMAKNLDYENYIPFAYQMRGRTDYGVKEVASFRSLILKYVVPLQRKYAQAQAYSLDKPILRPWDVNYDPRTSLPLGIVPVNTQLERTQKLFDELSPVLGSHFRRMRSEDLIDLPTRPGKQAGAYCTSFEDEQKVLVFCNSTGDAEDIRVLTHEMGHAFQGWESQHIEAVELQWGTAELAEVFSMGMEFLAMPHIGNFFDKENARKFSIHRWGESLYTLCYVAVVDEFQHWVYENPDTASDERDKKWVEVFRKYLDIFDYTDVEKYQAVRWYLQSHIFVIPFYYIDYALAEVCAMQLAMIADSDHRQSLDTYLKLARLGGTKSFLTAVKEGGMRSPFDENLMAELMGYVAKKIGL